MTSAIERLENLLDKRDTLIEELEEKVSGLEATLRGVAGGWLAHEELPKEQTLPVPRLELVWHKDEEVGWQRAVAKYRLVYRHLLDHCVAVPLGSTTVEGGRCDPPLSCGFIELPFRDGAHIVHDMEHMALPAYVVLGDRVDQLSADEFEKRRAARASRQ